MANATSDKTFQADVLESDVPVLVDLWAPWCGPCQMVGPVIEKLAQKAGDKARVFKLNVDENRETAAQYGITAIPTVMIFDNGEVRRKLVGVQPESIYAKELGI
ncbi:MAG: thioredoxin [Chitinivibrionales bacterium]|nr:thioredoxin [Chitinivibrionales bacterium]MBD3396881.1 thioredoxin [Chitinivibrionales bacterium]